MSALEDSLRKVYKLPSVTTESTRRMSVMPNDADSLRRRFRGKTGALTTKQEIGDEMRSMTGALMTEDEKRFLFDALQGAKGTMPDNRVDNFLLTREMMENRPPMENLPLDPNSTPEITPLGEIPSDKDPMDEMDAETRQKLDELLGKAAAQQMAPLAPLAEQLKAAGTGEDTALAHLRPGEIVIPPEFMEDDEFEGALERKFREFNINPEEAVVGVGIASLNPQTGLEQFGFFKKIFKGIKKVVKKVAPIAAFIPGVGTALGGVLGGIGGLATKIPGIGGALGSIGSTVASGIANLGIPGISSIAKGTAGGFSGIKDALMTRSGLFGGGPFEKLMGADPTSTAVRSLEAAREAAVASGDTAQVAAIDAQLATYKSGQGLYNQPQIIGTDPATGAPIYGQPQQTGPFGGTLGPRIAQGIGGILGGQGAGGGGFGDFAKMAGIGALAAKLGQLAKEDAEKQRGVPLTPMVMESPTGRYNIEAEIARRMGQPAPNPVEFGLLPEGTIPELSGGKPGGMMYGGAVEDLTGGMARGLRYGGGIGGMSNSPTIMMNPDMPVMAFAQGGAVQMQEGGGMDPSQFPRMDGDINGPGTETSDDIPAMLSDGEFVMTGQAVRGAGSYDMAMDPKGIISLVPSFEEDRERGMDLMYKMMDAFSTNAEPS